MTTEVVTMEHGPHWVILGARDPEAFLNARFKAMMQPGAASSLVHGNRCHMVEKGGRLRISALLESGPRGLAVIAAYPYTESPYVWPLKLAKLQHTADRSEGRLLGSVHGAPTAVFDTLFFKNSERYRIGEVVEVQPSAIALRFEAEQVTDKIAKDFAGFAPIAMVDKRSGLPPDVVEVHSMIEAAEPIEFHGMTVMRYEIALARMPSFTMKLDVFVAAQTNSRRFAVGALTGVTTAESPDRESPDRGYYCGEP